MSGSGSTPTNPVPAPRRGSKLKEPSASDKLYNFKTQFGNFMSLYEWMDKLGKWLLRLPEKDKRYQSWPTYWKTNFRCPRGRRIFHHKSFALRAEQRLETALRCFPSSLSPRAVRNIANDFTWQLVDSLHRNLANANCPWLREAGNSNENNLCKTDSLYF